MIPPHEYHMGIERIPISTLQLAEFLDVDPKRLIALERDSGKDRQSHRWWIVLEPKEPTVAHR